MSESKYKQPYTFDDQIQKKTEAKALRLTCPQCSVAGGAVIARHTGEQFGLDRQFHAYWVPEGFKALEPINPFRSVTFFCAGCATLAVEQEITDPKTRQ